MTSIADILGREIKDRFALALGSSCGASRLIGIEEKLAVGARFLGRRRLHTSMRKEAEPS